MKVIGILLVILIIVVLIISYFTYRFAFYWEGAKHKDAYVKPQGDQYADYVEEMNAWIGRALAYPYEKVSIQSVDGLKLVGKYYHVADGEPVQLLMHGYHGVAERDFSGGLDLAITTGHNALLIDERAHGESEGRTITFGIKESRDCVSWINYILNRCGKDTKILLSGVSMGAATVLMAVAYSLPENVKGILADCGYSSPKAIIQKVMIQNHLPIFPMYFFTKVGALVYGHFWLESNSAVEAMKQCRIPVLILHGEADDFVPCSMAYEIYDACASEDKTLFTVPKAPHAISMMVDCDRYSEQVREFCERVLR